MPAKIVWDTLSEHPDLPENQVHIWLIPLEQPAESLPDYKSDLSDEELECASRFHFERDRRRYLVSHSCLRRLLGAYLGVQPSSIQFEIAEHGKPHLGGDLAGARLNFNLAHSGEIALAAFCRFAVVGVDIEQVHALPDMQQVAARFFSQHEQAQLAQLPQDQRERAFFKYWTCKEAFIKNIGDGLYYPLDQFDIDLHPDQPARLLGVGSDPAEASQWQLLSFPVSEDYQAALAVRTTPSLHVRCLNLEPQG
jgi:4'-phosphopantetheinyl transferase